MNYHELSLDELKKIAKEKGISIGNSKQEKIIDKLKQYDLENNTESLINGVDIKEDISVTDNQSEMVYNLETDEKDKKENVIGTKIGRASCRERVWYLV